MTTEIKYNFDTSSDYTFDSSVIEITGGQAKLKLDNETGQEFNQDFASDTGFTYTGSEVEFTGGQVQQLDQTPTDSRIGLNYTVDLNANWNKDGATTGTILGGATLDSGTDEIDCTGGSTKAAYYTLNRTVRGSIKFKYRPNYTTGPASNTNLISHNLDGTSSDRLVLFNSPSGNNLRVTIHNSTGTAVATATTIAGFTFTSGQQYEILFQYDSTTGDITVYVDGTRLTPLNIGSWTRGTGAGRLYVGAYTGTYNRSNAKYTDVITYTTIQETGASYTPGYTVVSNVYTESLITLPTFLYSGQGAIQAFESVAETGSASARWILNGKYFDGGNWVVSDDSYAQANSVATINTNIGSAQVSDSIVMKLVLPDSATQLSTSDFTFTYTGQQYVSGSTVLPNAVIPITAMSAFVIESTIPANTDILFTMEINGADNWYDGADWVVSSGVAETNTATEINDNLASLPISPTGDFVRPKIWFTTDGSDTALLDTVCILVTYDVNPLDKPDQTIIFGQLIDMVAENMTGTAKLRIENKEQFFIDGNSVQPGSQSSFANDEGIASISGLIETASTGDKYDFYIDYNDEFGKQQTKYLGKSIAPDDNASNIANLTFELP